MATRDDGQIDDVALIRLMTHRNRKNLPGYELFTPGVRNFQVVLCDRASPSVSVVVVCPLCPLSIFAMLLCLCMCAVNFFIFCRLCESHGAILVLYCVCVFCVAERRHDRKLECACVCCVTVCVLCY